MRLESNRGRKILGKRITPSSCSDLCTHLSINKTFIWKRPRQNKEGCSLTEVK